MKNYTPPQLLLIVDGEFGSTEADGAVFDTGVVAYLLNEDKLTYRLAGWWHRLEGINGRDERRVLCGRTMDWWLRDPRKSWNASVEAIGYMNLPTEHVRLLADFESGHEWMDYNHTALLDHASFVRGMIDDNNIPAQDFVVCAKGPDTDCIIYNNAWAMSGISFNYRFARFSNVRDVERVTSSFNAGGIRYTHPERDRKTIPFAPADYYSSGAYKADLELGLTENCPYFGMPPAVEHTALYDAHLEGLDVAEYYTMLNYIAAGRIKDLV